MAGLSIFCRQLRIYELAAKLQRRAKINEGEEKPVNQSSKVFNPYTEFPEFSRKMVKDLETMFKKHDTTKDGFLDLMEIKLMMEQLGAPQTHIGLKAMVKEVDEDNDGQMSLREFMLIFRKAAAGELQIEGLKTIAGSVDVAAEGVGGAKTFFEAKAEQVNRSSKFEAEIKAEQEQKKREAEEARKRKEEFKAKMAHLN